MSWSARTAFRARQFSQDITSTIPRRARNVVASGPRPTVSTRRIDYAGALRPTQVSTFHNGPSRYGLDVITGPSKHDTIYALSSAQGRAGIAVIRVSGPACQNVYKSLCPGRPLPNPRYAAVRTLYDPERRDKTHILDSEAVALYLPGPRTVTGEDVLELHVHGGPATVKAVLGAIPRCASAAGLQSIRYAEPGEFSKRAFLNDRLDLSQVESLGDVLAADTEQQRRAAVRGNSGLRGQTYDAWRSDLLLARGEIEALIDFSEDQHFDESPRELLQNVTALVQHILASIDQHELAGQRTELLKNGIRIALLGPPNVGKSSLMNLIVGREASIVSREAGTTRDIVEASLDIGGYLCTFADTAGIRTRALEDDAAIGAIEKEGIKRARLRALSSDVIIVLASVEMDDAGVAFLHYDTETLELAAKVEQRIVVVNKCDSVDQSTLDDLLGGFRFPVLDKIPGADTTVTISCKAATASPVSIQKDPGGIHHLTQKLICSFERLTYLPEDMQQLLGGTERQRQLLAQCREHLEAFMREAAGAEGDAEGDGAGAEADIVLAAEHLRCAGDCLARITGRGEAGDVEEVLGVIFEKFCVGK